MKATPATTPPEDASDQDAGTPQTAWTGLDRLRVYIAIPSALLLFNSASFMIRNLMPNYLRELNLGGWVGPMQAVLPATALLLAVPMGLLSDRFSPRKLAVTGVALLCIFCAIIWGVGDAPRPVVLLAAYFLLGLASVMANNTIRPLYLKCIGHTRQAGKLALITAVSLFGYGIGAFLAGAAYKLFGWTLAQQFRLAMPLAVLGLAAAALMKDSSPLPFDLAAYRASLLQRRVILYFAILFVNALHFGIEAVCVAPFVKALNLTDWGVGIYFGSVSVVMVLTAIATTVLLKDHDLNRNRMWILGLTFSAVFNISVAVVTEPWQFFVLRYGHVISDAMMITASLRIVANMFPRGRVGGSMGLSSLVQTLGTLAGSLMAGGILTWSALAPHWQLALPFVIVGVAVLASVAVQLAMRERF